MYFLESHPVCGINPSSDEHYVWESDYVQLSCIINYTGDWTPMVICDQRYKRSENLINFLVTTSLRERPEPAGMAVYTTVTRYKSEVITREMTGSTFQCYANIVTNSTTETYHLFWESAAIQVAC